MVDKACFTLEDGSEGIVSTSRGGLNRKPIEISPSKATVQSALHPSCEAVPIAARSVDLRALLAVLAGMACKHVLC